MTKLRAILSFLLLALMATGVCAAGSPNPGFEIDSLGPDTELTYWFQTGLITVTNGGLIRYSNVVLSAWSATVNTNSGEVVADGDVRIEHDEEVWLGQHIRYNFKTRQMEAQQFRSGKPPVFLEGGGLRADVSNQVYYAYATNAFITTDDVAQPFQKVRAKYLKIVPGQYVEAHHAVLYLGDVPVFYFPYYSRKLSARANQFLLTPGYRSAYGAYLLGSYTWFLNEQFDGTLHLDYRQKRGVGVGADANYHLQRWGEGDLRGYYLSDHQPENNPSGVPYPRDRGIVWFTYQSTPFTNLSVKSAVRYESDSGVLMEFFERIYRQNPQPSTFFDVEKFWQNWSLDTYAQPRVNTFAETVERLPDVKLTGYRQQLGATPVFYESDSSFGYYDRRFAETNGPVPDNFAAARGDTFHQLLLPETFFGWLNVTPRVGGRFTYYSQATGTGATTSEEYRGVFNTGVEVSLKASRVWPGVQNRLFDVNGLRHIFEPAVNYAFVPRPNVPPPQLPQFDYQTPSLLLLPITFPDYNAIDSIQSQNVLRFGMRNKLQTKRAEGVDNVLSWDVFTDWYLRPNAGQTAFSDIYSALAFKPRSWLSLESENRFSIDMMRLNLARQTLALTPNDTWSWGITYYYLRQDTNNIPTAWGPGSQVLNSAIYYRINENWGLRASHYYDFTTGRLAEQAYSVYRDLRSWTAAVIVRLRKPATGSEDFTVGFTVSLKARPRYGLGSDAVGRYGLLGY